MTTSTYKMHILKNSHDIMNLEHYSYTYICLKLSMASKNLTSFKLTLQYG